MREHCWHIGDRTHPVFSETFVDSGEGRFHVCCFCGMSVPVEQLRKIEGHGSHVLHLVNTRCGNPPIPSWRDQCPGRTQE
jgi:hypothetical protein